MTWVGSDLLPLPHSAAPCERLAFPIRMVPGAAAGTGHSLLRVLVSEQATLLTYCLPETHPKLPPFINPPIPQLHHHPPTTDPIAAPAPSSRRPPATLERLSSCSDPQSSSCPSTRAIRAPISVEAGLLPTPHSDSLSKRTVYRPVFSYKVLSTAKCVV